jgi:hypothetical protein
MMKNDQTLEEASQAIAQKLKSMKGGDRLEQRTLMAIIEDRHEDASKLMDIVERRNALNLHSLEGGKESLPPLSSADNEHP